MLIKSSLNGTEATLSFSGRLDTTSFGDLERSLENTVRSGAVKITIDCAELAYISSAGLRILLAYQKRLMPRGGGITLKNTNDTVRQILQITGFARIFPE